MLSGCWMGAIGMAYADDARARAKATAINLIIRSSPVFKKRFLEAWIVVASGPTIVDPDQNGSRRRKQLELLLILFLVKCGFSALAGNQI